MDLSESLPYSEFSKEGQKAFKPQTNGLYKAPTLAHFILEGHVCTLVWLHQTCWVLEPWQPLLCPQWDFGHCDWRQWLPPWVSSRFLLHFLHHLFLPLLPSPLLSKKQQPPLPHASSCRKKQLLKEGNTEDIQFSAHAKENLSYKNIKQFGKQTTTQHMLQEGTFLTTLIPSTSMMFARLFHPDTKLQAAPIMVLCNIIVQYRLRQAAGTFPS